LSAVEHAPHKQALGKTGEDLAAAFIVQAGMRILERNYKSKGGEVDIIAKDGNVLVFVEVKCRKTLNYGVPQLAVTPFKQRQISKAALTWLAQQRIRDTDARFDVIAIQMHPAGNPTIEHIRNAFDLAY